MSASIHSSILTVCSIAMLQASLSVLAGPLTLNDDALDGVTAGNIATVNANALASAGTFATISTNTVARVTQTNPEQTALSGYSGVAGGEAMGLAVGASPSLATTVDPEVSVAGFNVHTFSINVQQTGTIGSVSGASVMQFGSYLAPLPMNTAVIPINSPEPSM